MHGETSSVCDEECTGCVVQLSCTAGTRRRTVNPAQTTLLACAGFHTSCHCRAMRTVLQSVLPLLLPGALTMPWCVPGCGRRTGCWRTCSTAAAKSSARHSRGSHGGHLRQNGPHRMAAAVASVYGYLPQQSSRARPGPRSNLLHTSI